MTAPLWLLSAWGWLKRNWKWLLLPVGVLLWLLGRLMAKKEVVVTSSELEKHYEVKEKVEAEASEKAQFAAGKQAAQLQGIDASHASAVDSVNREHIKEADEARGDPEKVNSFLKSVGKDMR